ncbi:uncharacterized protein LOC103524633 [Diaphorina citri]|uniref:Uncharacterized protein LOC103524633 n=1 Tax=Diaphorina citri TaxID=121845 RepID=A0A1S4ESM4_DIACI|nr:uncharacterized protein LOC103524633 [Diaphorina citri]
MLLAGFSRWLLFIFTLSSTKFTTAQDFIKNNLVDDTPQFMKNQIEVNKTILEVEQLIAKNSDLPRLTRGEILSLLENITKEDEMKIKKSKPNSNQNSNVHAKTNHPNPNVMVVLPVGTVSSTGAPRPQVSAQRPSFPTLDQIETSSQFENLVTIQKSSNKNEVKRQQPSDSITSSTSTEIITTTAESEPETTEAAETTTSSEVKDTQSPKAEETSISPVTDSVKAEDSSPSLSDLADSFGGGAVASEEPPPEALPSPRPNGLYFYVDWNTFLNVGSEDTKNRVNLRFAPKVGNPRLFLPVSVP